jgi:hypothetical protein
MRIFLPRHFSRWEKRNSLPCAISLRLAVEVGKADMEAQLPE